MDQNINETIDVEMKNLRKRNRRITKRSKRIRQKTKRNKKKPYKIYPCYYDYKFRHGTFYCKRIFRYGR